VEPRNYYEILGIAADATGKQIKDAYRRLARQYHPDLNPGDVAAGEKFKQINQAYQVLSESTPRSLYDYDLNSPKNHANNYTNNASANEYYKQGLRKSQLANYKEAITDYTKAIELDSNYADAYNKRGLCNYKLGEYSEALQDFTKAIYVNSNLVEAYYHRGMARSKLGYAQAAINDYNQALEAKPNYAQAYYRRGLVFVDLKHKPSAIADFQKAAQIFGQQQDLANYQLVLEEIKKLGNGFGSASFGSSNLIKDIFGSLIAVTGNPTNEILSTFTKLNRDGLHAVYVAVIFALIFEILFVTGMFLSLQSNQFIYRSEVSILSLIIVGAIAHFSLAMSSFAIRKIFRGQGTWTGDLYIAGTAVLPLGYLSIIVGIFSAISLINVPIILILAVFTISYIILAVYSGCHQISQIPASGSALAVPIILTITATSLIFFLRQL
jgi:curved DNA-binding protein CbpA